MFLLGNLEFPHHFIWFAPSYTVCCWIRLILSLTVNSTVSRVNVESTPNVCWWIVAWHYGGKCTWMGWGWGRVWWEWGGYGENNLSPCSSLLDTDTGRQRITLSSRKYECRTFPLDISPSNIFPPEQFPPPTLDIPPAVKANIWKCH